MPTKHTTKKNPAKKHPAKKHSATKHPATKHTTKKNTATKHPAKKHPAKKHSSFLTDSVPVNWQPGHMNTAQRHISKALSQTDIILELRDARLPNIGSPTWFKERIRQKTRLIVCNKSALADPDTNLAWLEFWEQQKQPAVLLDALSKTGLKQLFKAIKPLAIPSRQRFLKRDIQPPLLRVMILGLPNVGKSTLINRLADKKRTRVAPEPGITRGITWINLPPNFLLMDTPGVIPPIVRNQQQLLWLAWSGAIPDHIGNLTYNTAMLVKYLISKPQPQLLAWLAPLKLPLSTSLQSAEQLVIQLCQQRGWLLPKAKPNLQTASKKILSSFRSGKLGRYSFQQP